MNDNKKEITLLCNFLFIILKIKFLISDFRNNISHISLVEFFFARSLARIFIDCNRSGEFNILYNSSSILSCFRIQIPTPFSSKNVAFSSSCPGIGFITIIGRP